MPQTTQDFSTLTAAVKSGGMFSTATIMQGMGGKEFNVDMLSIERTAAQMREFFNEHKSTTTETSKKIQADLTTLSQSSFKDSTSNFVVSEATRKSMDFYLTTQNELKALQMDFQKMQEDFVQFNHEKQKAFQEIVQRYANNHNDSAIPLILQQVNDKEKNLDLQKRKTSYTSKEYDVSRRLNELHNVTQNFVTRARTGSLTTEAVQQQFAHLSVRR